MLRSRSLSSTPSTTTIDDGAATITNREVIVRLLPARVTFRY